MIPFLVAMVFLVIHIFIDGLLLSVLWRWFAVPVFHLPVLSIAQAIGVSLVVAFLTHQNTRKDDRDLIDQISDMVGWAFFRPALFLVIGLAVKGCLP